MPRTVDHSERRLMIAQALIRVASRDGLHAVTMRSVASEAGISLRLVQYYFDTKTRLMTAALGELERSCQERWHERIATSTSSLAGRPLLDAFFAEAIPGTDDSRTFLQLWTSCAMLALTDPEFAIEPLISGPRRLEAELADSLNEAQQAGHLHAGADVAFEAGRIRSLGHGLGTSVLIGHRSRDSALTITERHLDQIFVP